VDGRSQSDSLLHVKLNVTEDDPIHNTNRHDPASLRSADSGSPIQTVESTHHAHTIRPREIGINQIGTHLET
jgi:hypothetical protein